MDTKESIKQSRSTKLVPADKFDRHMKRARLSDINSRKHIFCQQTEDNVKSHNDRRNIQSSCY